MTATVWRIVGEQTGNTYGTMCAPDAPDIEQAYMVNVLFDSIVKLDSDLVPTVDLLKVQVHDPDSRDGVEWID